MPVSIDGRIRKHSLTGLETMIKTLTASTTRAVAGAALLLAVTASAASAQITFAGSTQFRLGSSGSWSSLVGVGGVNPQNVTITDGLTFTGTNFSVTTSPTGPGTTAGNILGTSASNLGEVFLKDRSFNYGGLQVEMLVSFSNPTVANGQIFTSMLSGIVRNCTSCFPNDNVFIDWTQPGVVNVPFTGQGNGFFSMDVADETVYLGTHTGYLAGDITTTTTPEPVSLALVGTGLFGIAGVSIRRRKKA